MQMLILVDVVQDTCTNICFTFGLQLHRPGCWEVKGDLLQEYGASLSGAGAGTHACLCNLYMYMYQSASLQ